MKELAAALLIIFVGNMAFATHCPLPNSREESALIAEEGPAFVKTGKGSWCLMKIIAQEKKLMPDAELSQEGQERQLMSVLVRARPVHDDIY